MLIKRLSVADSAELLDYYLRNTNHLKEWEPQRTPDFDSLDSWGKKMLSKVKEAEAGRASYFIGVDPSSNKIIAVCSLTNIVYGAFMAAYMGYSIDSFYEGRGYMKKLCFYALNDAFNKLHLHRVMANYMPRNQRSGNLLNSLGFVVEGKASKYLKINGKWEDHILTSLISGKCD